MQVSANVESYLRGGLAIGTQYEFGVDNLGITLVFWRIEVLQRNLHTCTMRIESRSNAEIDVP